MKKWIEPVSTDRGGFISTEYPSCPDTMLFEYPSKSDDPCKFGCPVKGIEIGAGEDEQGRDHWFNFIFDAKGVNLEVYSCRYDDLGAIDEKAEEQYYEWEA